MWYHLWRRTLPAPLRSHAEGSILCASLITPVNYPVSPNENLLRSDYENDITGLNYLKQIHYFCRPFGEVIRWLADAGFIGRLLADKIQLK